MSAISLSRPTLDDVFLTLTGHPAEETDDLEEQEEEKIAQAQQAQKEAIR